MTAGASWHFHNTKTTLPYHSGLQDEYVPELLSGKILKDPLNCHKQWFQKWKIHVRIPRIWTNHGFNMFQTSPATVSSGLIRRMVGWVVAWKCCSAVHVPSWSRCRAFRCRQRIKSQAATCYTRPGKLYKKLWFIGISW